MKIVFKTSKIQKIFNSEKELRKEYGEAQTEKIKKRMAVLKSVNSLIEVPTGLPDRMHSLAGQRKGQFAVDLKHPFRLIFEPANKPIPLKEDGGFDLSKITEIIILGVEDYH